MKHGVRCCFSSPPPLSLSHASRRTRAHVLQAVNRLFIISWADSVSHNTSLDFQNNEAVALTADNQWPVVWVLLLFFLFGTCFDLRAAVMSFVSHVCTERWTLPPRDDDNLTCDGGDNVTRLLSLNLVWA